MQSTEIYNPLTTSFVAGPAMMRARSGHTATMLGNDRILVVGGDLFGSAEIYDPITQGFSLVTGSLKAPRKFHSAILLQSGQVMIVGGVNAQDNLLNTAEVFDPASQSFYLPPTDMQTPRAFSTLKLLPDGKVQIIGGDAELSMEVFDPADGIFIAKALLPPNADLLVATLSTESRAALFSPTISQDPLLQEILTAEQLSLLNRADHSITELPARNQALVAGGVNSAGQVLNSAKLVSSSRASVTTDKTDYAPGQIVTITGSGFQPSEQIDIYFHEFSEEYPDVFLSAVANQQGHFVVAEFAPQEIDLGRIFTLTAIGQNSGFTAQTSFKDDNRVRFADTSGGAEVTTFGAINVNQCRTAFVQTQHGGTLDNAGENRVVNLSSTPVGAMFFSSSNCTGSPITSVTITAGTQSKQFSFSIGTTGSFTIVGDGPFSGAGNDATATVTVQAPPPTALSVSPAIATYGGTVNLSATLTRTSDTTPIGGKTISFTLNGGNAGTAITNGSGVATLAGVNLSGMNAATYSNGVGASFAGDNGFQASNGTNILTVNKKAATWTTNAASKIYGDADPSPLTTGSGSGFLPADGVTASYSRTAGETVGTYTISATLSPAGVLGNYEITYNTALFTINKRPITVTADAKSKMYEQPDPALSYQVTSGSLAFSDVFMGRLSRVAGELVGTYAIQQNTL